MEKLKLPEDIKKEKRNYRLKFGLAALMMIGSITYAVKQLAWEVLDWEMNVTMPTDVVIVTEECECECPPPVIFQIPMVPQRQSRNRPTLPPQSKHACNLPRDEIALDCDPARRELEIDEYMRQGGI
tara:strand:- start:81 stop:461 length:381 start_codon:yes stop_codon:yes gene_type:complete